MSEASSGRQRVDKWLWHARFFKTRARAGEVAQSGKLRLNGRHCQKAAQPVGPGDELSFPQAGRIRAIRVAALGTRRGPAAEAAQLYEDLDPMSQAGMQTKPDTSDQSSVTLARPTNKKARREIAAMKRSAP